jgi:hypothetical protein
MFDLLFALIGLLFLSFGLLLLTATEFREPTFWKFYFPPFYEKTERRKGMVVYRKLKEDVKLILSWYFIITSLVVFFLLVAVNLAS